VNNNITYVAGDVREPIGDGRKLILQCVNNIGVMGAGVAKSLMTKWPIIKKQYRNWYKTNKETFKLGNIQAVRVEKDIAVVNMIGQHGIYKKDDIPPIRYKAIEQCLTKVADLAEKYGASVHCPYLMCCDLAGGKWNIIEGMLIEQLYARNIDVTVYDLYGKRKEINFE
jgi:hypothetical protein